ncbi:MAG: HEAT repeat domain-containing protein [Candidatus Hodarchaeales archaeon]|jgi:hypothetical protein
MEVEQPDSIPSSITTPPNFFADFLNVLFTAIITFILWSFFFAFYDDLMLWFPLPIPIFRLSIGTIVAAFFLFLYTVSFVGRLLEVSAYKLASWQVGVPYMNYRTKCRFIQRKRLTFTCRAEQIAPFKTEIFEKCHKEHMWEACWTDRVPSILEVFDTVPVKEKRKLAILLAEMKDFARLASTKMYETLINDSLDIETRIWAGFPLAEMKDERGIEPLVALIGQYEQPIGQKSSLERSVTVAPDQLLVSLMVRYGEITLPYLERAIQSSESNSRIGSLVEILGKIKHESSIPLLSGLLSSETTEEYVKLQTVYALQEIGTEESFKVIISYLENAPEEEHDLIKQACMSRIMISFPILIDLLANPETSEEYYTRIGDILADLDAGTYNRFFKKLLESQETEAVKRLLTILKENTPEEEEYLKIHKVLDKHLGALESVSIFPD